MTTVELLKVLLIVALGVITWLALANRVQRGIIKDHQKALDTVRDHNDVLVDRLRNTRESVNKRG